jgi:hypothetical protein
MPEHDPHMPNAWNRGKPWHKVMEEEQGQKTQPSK